MPKKISRGLARKRRGRTIFVLSLVEPAPLAMFRVGSAQHIALRGRPRPCYASSSASVSRSPCSRPAAGLSCGAPRQRLTPRESGAMLQATVRAPSSRSASSVARAARSTRSISTAGPTCAKRSTWRRSRSSWTNRSNGSTAPSSTPNRKLMATRSVAWRRADKFSISRDRSSRGPRCGNRSRWENWRRSSLRLPFWGLFLLRQSQDVTERQQAGARGNRTPGLDER